jgi:hypothetical protein
VAILKLRALKFYRCFLLGSVCESPGFCHTPKKSVVVQFRFNNWKAALTHPSALP